MFRFRFPGVMTLALGIVIYPVLHYCFHATLLYIRVMRGLENHLHAIPLAIPVYTFASHAPSLSDLLSELSGTIKYIYISLVSRTILFFFFSSPHRFKGALRLPWALAPLWNSGDSCGHPIKF